MSIRLRSLFLGLLVVGALAGIGAWLFVYFGIYNVAATRQHIPPVYRLLDWAMFRSVVHESRDVRAPPDLGRAERVSGGAATFRAQCLQCHGAPGVAPEKLAFGMTPAPVNLMHTARTWKVEQVFWIVKHGAKMTGMPAWEYQLSDDQIWDVAAFVKAMAAMSPADYAAIDRRLPGRAPAPATAAPQAPGGPLREGDARLGREKTQAFLCHSCHVIPGIVGAYQHVGPPLTGIGTRSFIAGIVPNQPEQMIRFLLDPKQLDPQSAMPAMGLTEQDARDVAAFLATLRAAY